MNTQLVQSIHVPRLTSSDKRVVRNVIAFRTDYVRRTGINPVREWRLEMARHSMVPVAQWSTADKFIVRYAERQLRGGCGEPMFDGAERCNLPAFHVLSANRLTRVHGIVVPPCSDADVSAEGGQS